MPSQELVLALMQRYGVEDRKSPTVDDLVMLLAA